ncbi:PAS domain-containing protein [Paractinoplanes deccanensis]|nr:PAS domain S-box protein [Actinoplanes deccanensis]
MPRPDSWARYSWARGGPYAYIVIAVLTVTGLAAMSAAAPPQALTFGMPAIGPALAAASARPPAVLAVGGYAFLAGFAVSTWQGLLGSADQFARLFLIVCATAISWVIARSLRRLLRDTAAAARERKMLAAIAEQSTDAIIMTSMDGTVISWNRGAELLYGYTAEEIVGHGFGRVMPPDRQEAVEPALSALAAGERIRVDEGRRLCRDGTERWVSVTVSPIRDERGAIVAAAATERDITDQKRREAEERIAAERSARAARLESLGQLRGAAQPQPRRHHPAGVPRAPAPVAGPRQPRSSRPDPA